MVVLLACQTALGRAFFYAGSRAVVAALWNLNNRFSAEFTERFYGEIRSGRSTGEALRQAKLAFIAHPQFAHPFYWSSLVLIGDGTTVLYADTDPPARVWFGVLIAGLLTVAAGAAAGSLYRRRHPDRAL